MYPGEAGREKMEEENTGTPLLSVIIMAYNEKENLEMVLREFSSTLQALRVTYELVIINDGSTDGTGTLADDLMTAIPCMKVHHHQENQGLGGVYRTGFFLARGRFVTFYPADGQCAPSLIERYLVLMDSSDLVLGYIPERPCSRLAQTFSALEKMLYRLLFGYFPNFQGILMFRASLLDKITLKSRGRGWAVLMEFILKTIRGGYRVSSVATEVRPRQGGQSKVLNLRTIWANLSQVILLRFYLS
jgi:glycosyltransferase involved in cell wall biosynthesis